MENLKILREEHKLTQRDFAQKLGISKTTLCYYEQGKVSPSTEMLVKLAKFFGCSVDYLLGYQTKNVLYLDSFTEDQRELIRLVQTLDERKVLKVIGYIERLNDTPIEEVLWKMNKREEE